jgi:hypothetical protein
MNFKKNNIKEARKLEESLKLTEGIINELYEEWFSMGI